MSDRRGLGACALRNVARSCTSSSAARIEDALIGGSRRWPPTARLDDRSCSTVQPFCFTFSQRLVALPSYTLASSLAT
jgi:hypothetical protein